MTSTDTDRPTTEIVNCHVCHADTVTLLAPLSSGHIGRVCSECRACRLGRPYASKAEYYDQHPKPIDGKRNPLCKQITVM